MICTRPEIEREGGASSPAVATNSGSERAYVAKHPANLQPSGVAIDRAIPVSIVTLDPVLKVGNRVALNKNSTKQKTQAIIFGAIHKTMAVDYLISKLLGRHQNGE